MDKESGNSPSAPSQTFEYNVATSRNIGWVTVDEQRQLRNCTVAIAGLGGGGGVYMLMLARLGVTRFSIADFDSFEVHNFNRQAGAFMSTIGRAKVDVMVGMARDINPDIEVRCFNEGVTPENVGAFLAGADVYADGIDFFALDARRMIFAKARELGIPALTAAPLGMGVSLLYFPPTGMSFERYFRVAGHDEDEQYARFIAGISPAMLQRSYLVAPEAVDFPNHRGPSTGMACEMCAGVMGTSILKVLLNRGPLRPAPWVMQFDAYRQKYSMTWRPFGNANPLQWLLLKFIRPRLRGKSQQNPD